MNEGQAKQPVVCTVCDNTGWLADPFDSGIGVRCQCQVMAAADDNAVRETNAEGVCSSARTKSGASRSARCQASRAMPMVIAGGGR